MIGRAAEAMPREEAAGCPEREQLHWNGLRIAPPARPDGRAELSNPILATLNIATELLPEGCEGRGAGAGRGLSKCQKTTETRAFREQACA